MKNVTSFILILATVCIIPLSSCAQQNHHILSVKKGNYYQLIKMSLMPNEESKALLDDYFMKIGPAMMESKAKVYSFGVMEASTGNGPAQMFMIAEYTDKNKPDLIFESEAFLKNRNQRDHALSYLNEGYFLATQDGEFDLSKGELRLISLWVKEGKEEQLNSYFDHVMPDAIKKGAISSPFIFVPDPSVPGKNYNASMVFLAAWQSPKNEEKFYNGKIFKEHVSERDDALKFLEEYKITFMPEQ